jgi:hypothetical protein
MITSVSVISRIVDSAPKRTHPSATGSRPGLFPRWAGQTTRAAQLARRVGRFRSVGPVLGALFAGAAIAGCGLNVQSPDLFMLSRTGQGKALTLLVNDSGTIRCDGGKTKPLSDPMLLAARDLADDLNKDAQSKLHVPPAGPDSVFRYRITLQDGTVAFSDTAARLHFELARAELFAAQAAQGPCGLSG